VKIHHKGGDMMISVTSDEPIITRYELLPAMKPVVEKGDKIKPKMVIAKSTKHKDVIKSENEGKVITVSGNLIEIMSGDVVEKLYNIPHGKSLKVKNGDSVKKGDSLTSGHLNLREYMRLTDIYQLQKYIMQEVQSIYASQGQTINDKHIEIIARQMLSKSRILDAGDSNFLPGEIVDFIKMEEMNQGLKKAGKEIAHAERLLLGLTRIALYTDSWLSAASFQETIRVLVEAATTKRIDNLVGLKENVIIGKLIPAGETFKKRNPELVKELRKHVPEAVIIMDDKEEPLGEI